MIWNCFIVLDDCYRDFILLFDASHKLKSECTILDDHTDVSLETCKFLACDKGSNTVNYRDNICTLLDCDTTDPKIKPSNDGWNIYQLSHLMGKYNYYCVVLFQFSLIL